MDADKELIARVVGRVVREYVHREGATTSGAHGAGADAGDWGVFETMDAAVEACAQAQRTYIDCKMEARRRFIDEHFLGEAGAAQ